MGNFLTILNQNPRQPPQKYSLLKISLSKLREYHGSFKSICDTFAIDPQDFENIFGNNEHFNALQHFQLWDTDKNQLIDALELFAGLIVFSNDNFNEKVRFLFDIFDFNELNSLSIIDLEFMLISCCNATFKIYQMESDINEDNICEFLHSDFKEDQRINISQMITWCAQKQEIQDYCELIKIKGPQQLKKQEKNDQQLLKPTNDVKPLTEIITSKKYQQKLDWLSALSKKLKFLNQQNMSSANKDVMIKPKWVYGFRSSGVKKPLAYLKSGKTEKILYFTANIVVIYYSQLNQQEHYLEHDREVISLGIGERSGIVASGELGENAAIHIWNSQNLQNIGIIQGIHKQGVGFISFFKNDEFIATCGMRENTPILIYNIKDLSLVLSTFVEGNALNLMTIRNYIGEFKPNKQQNEGDFAKSTDLSLYDNGEFSIDSNILYQNYENSFLILSQSQIILFLYINNQFQQYPINILENNNDEDDNNQPSIALNGNITCAQAIRLNTDNPYLKAYTDDQDGAVQIVLGTDKGYLYYFDWPYYDQKKEFSYQQHYQTGIVKIETYKYGVIVATGASTIHLWDFNFNHNIKNIDLTNFQFKLFNYDIIDILVVSQKLMISTTNGDVIEIDMNQKQEWTQNKFIQKLDARRVNYITKFQGDLQAMCLMERQELDDKILFVAGSATIVYGFSVQTHEIVDVWTIGGDQPITCMDCVNFEDGGTIFVVGCAGTPSKLVMRIDWEEQPRTLEISQTVHDVRFSSDTYYLIAACNDGCIYLYMHNQNHYFNVLPKKIQFDNEIPICIDFVDDNKSFLVGTSVRNQYKIELPDLKNKIILQENEKINCTVWKLRYPLHTKNFSQNMLPIIIGGDIKLFLAAGESGYLYFWRDHEQLESNCGGFLKGHASQISRILMAQSQNQFFTVGKNDNTVIEWSVDFINEFNDLSKPFAQNQHLMINQQQVEKQIYIKDEVLVRELAYSFQGKNDFICDSFKDQFVLFRGTNQKTLNQHLYDLLSQDYVQEESNLLKKRPPPLSIELDFIFGFASFDKRQTLQYIHVYQEDDQVNEKKGRKRKKEQSLKQYKTDLVKKLSKNQHLLEYQKKKCMNLNSYYSKVQENNLQYEQYHENCHRNFVYFVSRIVIIYNPLTNKQKFYQGHQHKITAIAIHPLKFYVASGEASSKPSIHVWNVINTEPFKILPTFHKNGIIHLTFSQNAKLILSAGMDISFSIQITNWQTEEVVAFRNSGLNHIFDLKFNPFNSYEFVTCGSQNITIWNLDGRNLLRKYYINVNEEGGYGQNTSACITCISFISFNYNGRVENDIICGNNVGDIGLVTNGKYIVAKQRAHAKMINCLKVSEAFKNNVIIISAGEDEYIKFWDTRFNQINQIQISQMKHQSNNVNFFQHYQELKTKQEQKNCSAQSIDVYICIPDKKPDETKDIDHKKKKRHIEYLKNKTWSKILIGTRNGDIIEATFSLDQSKFDYNNSSQLQRNLKPSLNYSGESGSESSDEEDIIHYIDNELYGQQSKGFGFNYSLFLRSHSSQIFKEQNFSKKVYFSLHPYHPILVTVGEDQNMCVWDITSNKLLSIEYLSKTPSAIKFSPEGDLLVIGLTTGDLVIYDSKIKKSMHGKAGDKYDLPQFSKSLIQWIKVKDRTETAILNIEFSQRGELLAVSYDNVRQQKELEGKYEKEGSYITIYSNRASHKSNKPRGQEKLLYAQYIDIRCPSTYESYKTDTNAYGCAAYFMTFSQEQEKEYLLIYYQLIDNYLVRVNHDSQGTYLIWDLTNNNAVKQWDSIKNIQWRCFNFPNSINSQYQQYSNLIMSDNNDQQATQIPQNQAPPFQSVMLDLRTWENNKYQFLATGSIKGDLHFVKNSCLSGDKDFVTENIPKEKMFLAKSYAGHVSFVNQIEANPSNPNYLFTSGIADECVFKWKFVQEEQLWDLDFLEYKLDQPDVFSELVKKDKFINLYSEILPIRKQAADIKQNVDNTRPSPVELKLKNIIGRNAYTKLNNLFYDFDENIVYIAGCNLVIINPKSQDMYYDSDDYEDMELNQQVIKLDQSDQSCDSEISCISLSQDKKFLVAGTIQMNGKILIWDICSRTCIRTFILKNVPIILLIKFAFDNRHLCCVGLTSDYTMKVFLIDSHIPAVLGCANFPYSLPFKIKDIQFFPDSIYKFVTCGVQHMSVWTLNGGQLSYNALEIENPKDIEEQKKANQQDYEKQQEEQNLYEEKEDENRENEEEEEISKENLRVIFLCLTFVYDIIITGGEDGYLYIWEDKVIKQKHLTQKKIIIMALNSLQNTNLFVSGSMNGVINLWSIQKGEYYYVLERVFQHNISREESIESIKYPQNIIQSLCIGSKYILVGTKSGDIYEILRPQQEKDDNKFNNNKQHNNNTQVVDQNQEILKLRISCNDDDIPQSLAFSSDSTLLYTITSRGLFSVWNVSYLERRYVKNFAIVTHSLIVCKHSEKIIIAFENEIQVLNKEEVEDSDQLSFVLGHKIQLESTISDMKMSHKENLLAVALNPSKDLQAKIEIYDANRDDGNFKILCQVGNLPTSIEYIDFTQDNYYLIYKDNFEEVSIIDLKNLKKINTLFVEHDAKWCSDGIKVSEKTKGVFTYYNDENKIDKIVPIGEQAIAVTDEMGTIRIFEYPCESAIGHGYLKCYTDHLNYINQCVMSPDQQYLVTSSQMDRCIIIWNVIQNQVQMDRDSDMEQDEIDMDQGKDGEYSQIQQQ